MDPQTLPPGLEGEWSHLLSGGDDQNWSEIKQTRFYTNAFILQDDKILLGHKKRGVGQGFFNGFGGKVEPGESSAEAALRELQEESGVTAPLMHAGVLLFTLEGTDWAFYIDIYRATEYTGDIIETDEMKPQWFNTNELPFDNMWQTDIHWLPLLLKGTSFKGRADFKTIDGISQPTKWWIGTQPA